MKIGNKELELLTHIAEHPGATTQEVTEHFQQKDGIGRTTVMKTIDRLIEKGFLERTGQWGAYRLNARVKPEEVQEALTEKFVRETLGGSITPFVAYLDGGATLTNEEIEELKSVVERLEREAKS